MSIKSILVHADQGPGCDRRIRLAMRLADQFSARLTGIAAEAFVTPLMMSGHGVVDGAIIEAAYQRLDEHLRAAELHFRDLTRGGRQVGWLSEQDYPDKALALHARGADLIVADRAWRHVTPARAASAADLVMQAGTPVLLAPDGDATLVGDHVIVAWKDTREARRAVGDAMPFLKRAQAVTIVAVGLGEARRVGANEVAERLSMHGVKADVEIIDRGRQAVAVTLEAAADRHSSALIVAGGYGRSRLQEWVLGGVTEDLINASSKFVLLSH